MGLFKRAMRGEEIGGTDESSEEGKKNAEEKYMKLYMKIGRDFVHKDDLYLIVRKLLEALDPNGLSELTVEELLEDVGANKRAEEYKFFLETGKKGSDYYKDLLDLSEE